MVWMGGICSLLFDWGIAFGWVQVCAVVCRIVGEQSGWIGSVVVSYLILLD